MIVPIDVKSLFNPLQEKIVKENSDLHFAKFDDFSAALT